jgi:hypothetical protein
MRRREFIAGLGSAAAWPLAARAQQAAMPVVGLVTARSAAASAGVVAAFRKGLGETGYVDGQNVTVEYYWLEGQFDRLPALMADLVRRRVAVIATPAGAGAPVAKAGAAKSMRPLPPLRATAPMPSSSLTTGSSPAAACKLPPWRQPTGFLQLMGPVNMSQPAG